MAVPEQTPYKEFTANGITKIFPLGFDILKQDHLIILVNDLEPTVGSWSLDLINNSVVFALPPANGANIKITRNTPLERTTDYQSYDNSFRPSPVNYDFDRIWWKLQELGVADALLKLYCDRLHIEQKNYIDNQNQLIKQMILDLNDYVDQQDENQKIYFENLIYQQGVSLKQLKEYYQHLLDGMAEIAEDKGWLASLVVDASGKNQQEINNILLHEFNVLDYGADPTGFTDSHKAFVDCAKALSEAKSGIFVVPYGFYVVGKQNQVNTSAWRMLSEYVVDFRELNNVVIDLRGCTIKNKSGIYFGQFDANLNPIVAQWSVPSRCSGGAIFNLIGNKSVLIKGSATLDGNLTNAIIGGNYGDFGIQIEYDGVYTNGNIKLVNDAVLKIIDFGRDSYYVGASYRDKNNQLVVYTDEDILPVANIKNVTSIRNARQGLSWTGGSGSIEDCHFEKIGKTRLTATLPKAGVDVESESGVIRDLRVSRCSFMDCGGIGLVNTSGVVRRDTYTDCRFIGFDTYPLYAFSGIFERCFIVGRAGVGGTKESFADRFSYPKFKKCTFSSRLIDSSGIGVYGSAYLLEPASVSQSTAFFEECDFYAVDGFIFATTLVNYTFKNCKFYIAPENIAEGSRSQFMNCTLIDCEFHDLRINPEKTLSINRNNNDSSVIWDNVRIATSTGKLIFGFVSGVGTVSQHQQDLFSKHSLVLANNSNVITTSRTNRSGTIAIYSKSVLPTVPTDVGNPFYPGDIIENWSVNSNSWTQARCTGGGYSCSAVWVASTTYSLNQYVSANNRVYRCSVAGTSGTVAPSHTTGTATDGTVTWEYLGNKASFREVGVKAKGLTAASTAAEIYASLKAAGIAE